MKPEFNPADYPSGKPLEWAELWAAMKAAPQRWQPTTEHMFYEMLGAVPPRDMANGAFLVGEPDHHTADGQAVYACFKQVGEEYETRYMTHADFSVLKSIKS